MKIYRCAHCGNIIFYLHDAGVPVFCCGEKMQLLQAGSVDAAVEKHVPAVTVDGSRIHAQVGSVIHPMAEEHYIEWISLQTAQGYQRKMLNPGDAPKAEFALCDGDEVKAVYAYCNIHGLWRS